MTKKIVNLAIVTLLVPVITSCTITSGPSAGRLPIDRQRPDIPTSFTATNGMHFRVIQLNAATLPLIKTTSTTKSPITIPALSASRSGQNYKISIGDVIDIGLADYPEIMPPKQNGSSNIYANGHLVDQSGYIQFPLIGRIQAQGLTTTQLATVLSNALSRYLKHPDPQVRVLSYRGSKFYIDGQVTTPGQFAIADQPISIYSAIGLAGGAQPTADTENITLTRNGRNYNFGLKSMQKLGYSPNNLMLQDGDVVRIGNMTQNRVTVLGEFIKPSPVPIPEDGISLASVIGEVSGLNGTSANAQRVYVLREDPRQQSADIYHVDLTSITNLAVANRFTMQPGDVVYVDPTGLVRWNRVISTLLPVSTITSVANTL